MWRHNDYNQEPTQHADGSADVSLASCKVDPSDAYTPSDGYTPDATDTTYSQDAPAGSIGCILGAMGHLVMGGPSAPVEQDSYNSPADDAAPANNSTYPAATDSTDTTPADDFSGHHANSSMPWDNKEFKDVVQKVIEEYELKNGSLFEKCTDVCRDILRHLPSSLKTAFSWYHVKGGWSFEATTPEFQTAFLARYPDDPPANVGLADDQGSVPANAGLADYSDFAPANPADTRAPRPRAPVDHEWIAASPAGEQLTKENILPSHQYDPTCCQFTGKAWQHTACAHDYQHIRVIGFVSAVGNAHSK